MGHLSFCTAIKSPAATLALSSLTLFVAGTPASQSQPATQAGSVALCEFTSQAKYYYSSIFDVPNDNEKANWEVAWGYYVLHKVDPFPGNGGCTFYKTRAGAQHDLDVHKKLEGSKLVETGWRYTGPEQLPPPAPAPKPGGGR